MFLAVLSGFLIIILVNKLKTDLQRFFEGQIIWDFNLIY